MFAPAIGVDEDVANANSTGCLAAHLLDTTGAQTVATEVEQGDTLVVRTRRALVGSVITAALVLVICPNPVMLHRSSGRAVT